MKRNNHPAQVADSDLSGIDSAPAPLNIKPPRKYEASLFYTLQHPEGFNALNTNARSFEDFDKNGTGKHFYTTCLHTDIAKLRNTHGVSISDWPVKYVSRHGYSADFKHYRLTDQKAAERAVLLVNQWRVKRGEVPLPEDYSQYLIGQFPKPANLK